MNSKDYLDLLMSNQKKVKDEFKFINLKTHEQATIEDCYENIKKDLDRLENLENAIDILKDNLHLYKGLFNCLSINGGHEYSELTDQEYELLKEVLGNV